MAFKQKSLEKENSFVQAILDNKENGLKAKTKLETDEKVLARVTDGIYRLPGSALRELISNAYDADAENVIINTDCPRFGSMTIRDDGNGMSIDTLSNLIHHIGNSAKRNNKGKDLEVTEGSDTTISPNKKRKLIGKIGIGLFSVAQLTREFEIITKQVGNNYYLKAKIRLHNYSEEYIEDQKNSIENRGASFEAGEVEVWTENTDNIDAHGTDIILKNIKQSAIEQLKSNDIWGQELAETDKDEDIAADDIMNSSNLEIPTFHVGNISGNSGSEYFNTDEKRGQSLPWDNNDSDSKKFPKLYDAILGSTKKTINPKLGIILDNYLNMLWTLSLSIPLDYIDTHPFELNLDMLPEAYIISNKLKGQVEKIISDDKKKSFSELLGLKTETKEIDFNVVIDGIKLFRPLKFTNLPRSSAIVTDPILFIGSYSPNLSTMNIHDSGGDLSFDAYIMWSPKVIPRDHNGVLIRLHNASGILFDETFMKHQVAEHTIKSQLTAEIFVNKGLDSALNIDRESFNISHPHYQIIMRWLHQAIRQVINRYKSIKKEKSQEKRKVGGDAFSIGISEITNESVLHRGVDPDEKSKLFIMDDKGRGKSSEGESQADKIPIDAIRIEKKEFLNASNERSLDTPKGYNSFLRVEAILQILDSYNLLNNLTPEKQKNLILDLTRIVSFEVK
ncbi:TPA: ATP-binding protein [Providencia rettgeri]|uniref:ATP-binding protein n=1 Tax=Providencia TaxID=586 RepID=UPI001CA625D4|nr:MULTISPECIES: ATP-binding protein [Providencia]MCL0020808.1 ATP-binding protein [Providencia rettgeri]QZY64587.1 ATP-binding protein [Providencia rettgeri]HEM7526648.1 ATP-binding protein [Providencia rettgeri]